MYVFYRVREITTFITKAINFGDVINKGKWFLRAVSWKPSFKLDRNLRVIFVLQLTYLYQGSTDIIYLCRCMWLTTVNDVGPALYFTCIRELTQTLKMISILDISERKNLIHLQTFITELVPSQILTSIRLESFLNTISVCFSLYASK